MTQNLRVRGAIIGAAALFVVDAFILNQGVLSFFVAFICLVGFVLLGMQSLVRRLRKKPNDWQLTAAKLAIVLAAALLSIAYVYLSNSMAEARTVRIAAACDSFNRKYQRYPHQLGELVPEFLPSVPHAKYVLNPLWSSFMYIDKGPLILYYAMPPFGRRVYHLQSKTWTHMD